MAGKKRSMDEMIQLAYDLQNAIIALCGKRPLRITTNKDFKLLRILWMRDFERKGWYDGVAMKILIQAFSDKHGIPVREITPEQDNYSAVYLTKTSTDPEKTGE
ncbi:MAG TPA: hypothetical protein PKG52_02495 [bacterium]|nr:hypothetical protein [bacterium]